MTEKTIDHYSFSTKEVLGSGAFGTVFKAIDIKSKKVVALKMISKDKVLSQVQAKDGLMNEIKIMKRLTNPNIVQLLDVLETMNNYYLIQEVCEGGDLAKFVKKNGFVNEKMAVKIMTDILKGFLELIRFGIIHRDLKPANILIQQNTFKLADFGFAKIVDNFAHQLFFSQVGTPLYMSPQILQNKKYSTKCDIWSFGFIFYEILYGRTPWVASAIPQLVKNINTQPLKFDDSINKISSNLKDIISKCLVVEESERISWYDLFAHPVFQLQFQQTPSLQQLCEKKELYISNRLRELIAANQISVEEIFEELEITEQGILEIDCLRELFLAMDKDMEDYEINYLFDCIDTDKNGEISYEEFNNWMIKNQVKYAYNQIIPDSIFRKAAPTIYASPKIQQQQYHQQTNLISSMVEAIQEDNLNLVELFYKFNRNQNGIMNYDEFTELMLSYDEFLTEDEIKSTFNTFDLDKKNRITLQQFKYVLESEDN